ncbi:hypothetical protein B0J11DRAFT_423305, partial [Dendryphion nanum]
ALSQIRQIQRRLGWLFRGLTFARLVKEVCSDTSIATEQPRFRRDAMEVIQNATGAFLTTIFEAIQLAIIHRKRVTIMKKDSEFVQEIARIISPSIGSYLK